MQIDKKTMRNLLAGAAGCIVLYWLLHETQRMLDFLGIIMGMVRPFVIGACLAFILNVPMRAIERNIRKIHGLKGHRGISILLTILLVLLIIVLVVYMLVPQIKETVQTLGQQLPGFLQRTQEKIMEILQAHPDAMDWLTANTDLEQYDWNAIAKQAVDLFGNSLSKLFSGAVNAVGGVISGVWSIFLALVFAVYSLAGKETLARQGRRIAYSVLPERWADQIIRVLRLTNSTFSNFISGQCLEVVILGSMFAVTMTVFGMPYVPLVSVLVAVTAFIPVVGAWIGCVLGAFFILVNDPMQAVWFVVMFVILQQIENNLIYPRVVGTSIGLPSMWVLVAVTIGGDLMGVGGMLLMIPLSSVVYTLLREFTAKQVQLREIKPEKLEDQPPVLTSKLKEKREASRKKREAKKAAELAELMKKNFRSDKNK